MCRHPVESQNGEEAHVLLMEPGPGLFRLPALVQYPNPPTPRVLE